MTVSWTIIDPPEHTPAPRPCRGIPGLAASGHPSFPESVPYARDSILRVRINSGSAGPTDCGAACRQIIDEYLADQPAILFSGLPISTREHFSEFIGATDLTLHDYKGGNAIRDRSTDRVSITSTETPEVVVTPHNENAYMPEPPDMVFFCCLEAAEEGGEVPVNDARNTPGQLPVDFVEEMRIRHLRYIRRMRQDDNSYEIGWQTSFGTTDKSVVNAYLDQQEITYRWHGDSLEFWFVTPVFRRYRGQEIWFNQLSECNADYWLYHPESVKMGYTRETCQSDTAYGDGEPFNEAIRIMVRSAIWRTTELVRLSPGEVILLDNNLYQHGRMAYRGTRTHLAALALHS